MSKFRGSITLSIFSLSTLSNYHYWQSPKTRYWRLVRPYQTGIPPARLLALIWAHSPDLLSSSLYFIAYRKDSVFYETCRLGTTCNAKCPQMASPQKGSWRKPAQGKCSVPCLIWSRPWLRKITALRRGAFGERNAPTSGWCIIAPLVN